MLFTRNMQDKCAFARLLLYFSSRCNAAMLLDKLRFPTVNRAVAYCGLCSPQVETLQPAIGKQVFCWSAATFIRYLFDIIQPGKWYLGQRFGLSSCSDESFSPRSTRSFTENLRFNKLSFTHTLPQKMRMCLSHSSLWKILIPIKMQLVIGGKATGLHVDSHWPSLR